MTRLTRSIVAASLLAGVLGSASAATHLYNFTATVNLSSQGGDLTGANSAVTGSFSYDDAVAASTGPYPHGSAWYPALLSFSFAVGPLSGTLTTPSAPGSVLIHNNFDATTTSYQDAFYIQPQAMTGNARGGNALISASLGLTDPTMTAFAGTVANLPTTPFSSANFGTGWPHVQFSVNYAGGNTLYATVDTVTPVPEAAEWAMMLAGLGVVGAAARRGRRQSRA